MRDNRTREPNILVCNRRRFTLELWKFDGEEDDYTLVRAYPIAVGQKGYRTDPGFYRINARSRAPEWRMPDSPWVKPELRGTVVPAGAPNNPIRSRFLGFGHTGEGIHGTLDDASIGTAASHGCIRMTVPDVEELYPSVPLGTILFID